MKFKNQLIKGTLVKRYKRFLADIELPSGEIVTAHCPNSGSMLEVAITNNTVYLSPAYNPTAKLRYKWELIEINNTLVGVNTSSTNKIAEEALSLQLIPELSAYTNVKRESVYKQGCRFDFQLNNSTANCFVEVKNVTLVRKAGLAEFPDAVTTRGLKHINELINAKEEGFNSYLLYIIQREDCNSFKIADDIDKSYLAALKLALKKGVQVLCYSCHMNLDEIKINVNKKIDFIL